uniref:DNA-directed RNA polymerase n=1 Tax=Physcomitrium patens TaxID=3218 RepID=A0A7I4F050_PHYPA
MDLSRFIESIGMDSGIVKLYDIMMLYIVDLIKNITVDNSKIFNNVYVSSNQKRYQECINTLSTYECSIIADDRVVLTISVPIGCSYKPPEEATAMRGLFVIEGRRKVLMCQERNYTFMYLVRKEKCELQLSKCHCEIYMVNGVLKIFLSHNNLVNIFAIMKVLWKIITSAKREILSWTDHPKEILGLLLESQLDATTLDSNIIHSTERILATFDYDKKVKMLSLMICRFIESILSLKKEDDRNCLSFKCMHTPTDIVRRCIEKRNNKLNQQKIRSNSKQKAVIASALNRISKDIQSNFKTGVWEGYTQGDNKRTISQVLSSKSTLDSVSHVRRVEISSKERAILVIDMYNNTYVDPDDVLNHLDVLPQGNDVLFINGLFIARTWKDSILRSIKTYKRKREAFMFVSIHYSSDKKIHIQKTRSRYSRPLLIYTNGSIPVCSNTIVDDMYKASILEMIDAIEQMQCFIATTHDSICNQHTHIEIHPSFMFELSASMTPFVNFNQSSRIVFQSAMSKQAMPLALHIMTNMISDSKILTYAQKPICTTTISNTIKVYNGVNVVIAILSYFGYNQEDSLLFNKSSIDKGLFSSIEYEVVEIIENKFMNEILVYVPDGDILRDNDGIILVGQQVKDGDTIAAKLVITEKKQSIEKIVLKSFVSRWVDKVTKHTSVEGNKIVRVRILLYRFPIVGHKFTSRHSQKGIIGAILSQEDLSFTKDEIAPDLIINPHVIPSRMTMGHLLEMVMYKIYVLDSNNARDPMLSSKPKSRESSCIDATVFNRAHRSFEADIAKLCKEKMYCGATRLPIEAIVATGICYYHVLRHQARDKAHSISKGVIQSLTKQPVEGRSRKGGLRFGEMEKDYLIAHGVASMLFEKLKNTSDLYEIWIYHDCSMICSSSPSINCNGRNTKEHRLPYSFKLLAQELSIANIRVGLKYS